jgi:phosphoribosylamine--glycine ligase
MAQNGAQKNGNGTSKKLKFLFVSHEGNVGDLAWQIKKEGHDVKYYIDDKANKDVCDGFVDKSEDWLADVDWTDIVVFDDVDFGSTADRLRKQGKLVVGGSTYTDRLEEDREFGQEEMQKAGMNVIPSYNFTDFDEAIKFVKENPGRYVIKPSGKAQGEKELSFVGQEEDGKDIIEILERYKRNWGKKIRAFLLQKYVSGVEVAIGAFFNGKEFIMPININFEHKRLFPGGTGPNAGELGTSMFWTSKQNELFRTTLDKMKPRLQESGYVGYFDINTISNVKGIYPLEVTARFGYPTISIQMEGVLSPWSEFLYALAKGESHELKTKRGFQVGIVVAVPPFPFTDPKAFAKYSQDATIIFKKPNLDGMHLGDVKLVEGDWQLAGHSGYALVVTGSGSTMEEARKQAYSRVKNIMIPNMFYRTDIGAKWTHDSDRLQTWGYLY